MHARLTIATVLAATAALVGLAPAAPAGAEVNPGLNPNDGEYSKAAEWVAAAGGGSGRSGSNGCRLDSDVDGTKPAHYEWNSYPSGDGTWSVWLNCVLDGENVPTHGDTGGFPAGPNWDVIWYRFGVRPRPIEEMAADVLARNRPPTAGIFTHPGAGVASMVGIDTWLWLDEATFGPQTVTETEGPPQIPDLLSVTIVAVPKPGGTVTWSTGDGIKVCPDGGMPPGSCVYEYNRSSLGQPHTDAAGNPAFEVTASYTYTGTYTVSVMGTVIDSGSLGDIPLVSTTYLAVEEAEAINNG